MLNQVIAVGRIVKDPELIEDETGKKVSYLTIAIPRSYKNQNGEYDTDFIDCVLLNGIAEGTTQYCKKGDLVGIKGRLETDSKDLEDGSTIKNAQLVAEKVTFLSNNKKED